MSYLFQVVGIALVALSLVARVMIRRKHEDHSFVLFVLAVDTLFMFVGVCLVGLANASMTNPYAKYEEGFPNVDTGGLPVDVALVNLLFFVLPLIVVGVRFLWRKLKEEMKFFVTQISE